MTLIRIVVKREKTIWHELKFFLQHMKTIVDFSKKLFTKINLKKRDISNLRFTRHLKSYKYFVFPKLFKLKDDNENVVEII